MILFPQIFPPSAVVKTYVLRYGETVWESKISKAETVEYRFPLLKQ
ncbi:Uncharacterised protein [Bacteroides xylanisolvens]|nr:Uncharacterised protein [Bacteroides xylanisolvens]